GVLKALADRMSRSLRSTDTLARLSGDEFVAIVEARRRDELPVIIEHLMHQLKAPLTMAGVDLFVTASVGVSAYPADAAEATELLRLADRAMYRAKAEGRDTSRFHTSDRGARAAAAPRLAVTSDL